MLSDRLAKRDDESVTAFTMRQIRAEILEEAATIAEREFVRSASTPVEVAYNSAIMDVAEALRRAALNE